MEITNWVQQGGPIGVAGGLSECLHVRILSSACCYLGLKYICSIQPVAYITSHESFKTSPSFNVVYLHPKSVLHPLCVYDDTCSDKGHPSTTNSAMVS